MSSMSVHYSIQSRLSFEHSKTVYLSTNTATKSSLRGSVDKSFSNEKKSTFTLPGITPTLSSVAEVYSTTVADSERDSVTKTQSVFSQGTQSKEHSLQWPFTVGVVIAAVLLVLIVIVSLLLVFVVSMKRGDEEEDHLSDKAYSDNLFSMVSEANRCMASQDESPIEMLGEISFNVGLGSICKASQIHNE